MRHALSGAPQELDFMSPPIPWRQVKQEGPLRIGVITACPSCDVSTPMMETILSATRLLGEAGHVMVKIQSFPNFQRGHDVAYNIFDMDNSQTGLRHVTDSGESMVPATKDLNPGYPNNRKNRDLDDLWSLSVERQRFRKEWHAIFLSSKLDVLLMPPASGIAPVHNTMKSCPYMVM